MNCLNTIHKWKICNILREWLVADAELQRLVGDKIFPMIAPENTVGNFLIYNREKYSKQWAKQGYYEDKCLVAINVVSDNYDQAIEIAERLDNILTGQHITDEGKIMIDVYDSTETFADLKYIETIVFEIK